MKLKDLSPEELLKTAIAQEKTIKGLEEAATAQAAECEAHSKNLVACAAKIEGLETAASDQATECEEHSKTIADQTAKIGELEAKVDEKEEQISVLNAIIGNAKAQTTIAPAGDKKVTAEIPTELVEVEGKEYAWKQASFRFPGDQAVHFAADVANDADLLTRLLAIPGQKILIEQA